MNYPVLQCNDGTQTLKALNSSKLYNFSVTDWVVYQSFILQFFFVRLVVGIL